MQVLSKRQSQIIDLLARNRGRVVDFEQFQHYVWEDTFVDNATIRAEVNRLKKVLKEDFSYKEKEEKVVAFVLPEEKIETSIKENSEIKSSFFEIIKQNIAGLVEWFNVTFPR